MTKHFFEKKNKLELNKIFFFEYITELKFKTVKFDKNKIYSWNEKIRNYKEFFGNTLLKVFHINTTIISIFSIFLNINKNFEYIKNG